MLMQLLPLLSVAFGSSSSPEDLLRKRVYICGPMTQGLQADLDGHNLDGHNSSFIVSANPFNIKNCEAPNVRDASKNQGLWYDGECYGAAVANDIYKFFKNEDDTLTPLGAHAHSLELPLPTFGIDKPPVGVVVKTLEEWEKVKGNQSKEVNQVMTNIADFKDEFERHQASLKGLSKLDMMSTWTTRLDELHQKYKQDVEAAAPATASRVQPPTPAAGPTTDCCFACTPAELLALFCRRRNTPRSSDTGYGQLESAYTGFEDDIIPFLPMQVNDFTWSHTHLAKSTVLRFFGANTPELVQQVLELTFHLSDQLGEPSEKKYSFVERLSKFVTMLKPTGCFTDVANFAYYVADHAQTKRRPEDVDNKIPITKIADALQTLKTKYLEPLDAINQHIDAYISATSARPQALVITQQERDAIMRIVECFPHKLYHDSERDDICVFAMMSYANNTLKRLVDAELLLSDTALERKVAEYRECADCGGQPIVVQLAPEASLTIKSEWAEKMLKKCTIVDAKEKLAGIKNIYKRCDVRVLEDPDTTNLGQVIDASWNFKQ